MLILLGVNTLLLHSDRLKPYHIITHITVLNEVNSSQTEDILSPVSLIKLCNM